MSQKFILFTKNSSIVQWTHLVLYVSCDTLTFKGSHATDFVIFEHWVTIICLSRHLFGVLCLKMTFCTKFKQSKMIDKTKKRKEENKFNKFWYKNAKITIYATNEEVTCLLLRWEKVLLNFWWSTNFVMLPCVHVCVL